MLQFTLPAKQAKLLVKALENVNDDAIFKFDTDGLTVSVSDTFRNRLLEITLPVDFFTSYLCEESIDLGVIISRLKDVTKTLSAKDEVSANFSADEPNFLILTANGIRRRVRLVNTDLLSSPPLMVYEDYIYTLELTSDSVMNFLKAATAFHTIDVSVLPAGATLTALEGEDEVSMHFDSEGCNLSLDMADSLTTHGVTDLLKGLSTLSGDVVVRGGPTIPICFEWSWGSDSRVACYVTRWE